ncbi:hypothetical protein HPP92_021084 [Vanilla planifolia]|uniref:Uncharacterized protein n=1 Tax=Vanilla planifolia TaxID=51239 RepID=A0A835Q0D5_VANPL|nr:hypothetical protein HPP92_021084 [Vanilla planifolia]
MDQPEKILDTSLLFMLAPVSSSFKRESFPKGNEECLSLCGGIFRTAVGSNLTEQGHENVMPVIWMVVQICSCRGSSRFLVGEGARQWAKSKGINVHADISKLNCGLGTNLCSLVLRNRKSQVSYCLAKESELKGKTSVCGLRKLTSKLNAVEMVAAYTSSSFGVGYFGSSMDRPKVSILRSTAKRSSSGVCCFGARVDLNSK